MTDKCTHLDHIKDITSDAAGCEECLAIGDQWIHLRQCMTCGQVGCCDDSKNKHASGHARATGHPIIRSYEPGEFWMWCFVDEVIILPE